MIFLEGWDPTGECRGWKKECGQPGRRSDGAGVRAGRVERNKRKVLDTEEEHCVETKSSNNIGDRAQQWNCYATSRSMHPTQLASVAYRLQRDGVHRCGALRIGLGVLIRTSASLTLL